MYSWKQNTVIFFRSLSICENIIKRFISNKIKNFRRGKYTWTIESWIGTIEANRLQNIHYKMSGKEQEFMGYLLGGFKSLESLIMVGTYKKVMN